MVASHIVFLDVLYCLQEEQQCRAQLCQSLRQEANAVILILSSFKILLFIIDFLII